MKNEELEKILTALRADKFEVKMKGMKGITKHVNYAGVPFLRLNGNASANAVDAGICTVLVARHEFVCNLNTGVWLEHAQELTDSSLIAALAAADGVVAGEHKSGHQLCRLYSYLHGLPADTLYCWEADDTLKDVSELGEDEVDIVVRYSVKDEGGWGELEVSVDDAQLLCVYRLMKRYNYLPSGENEVIIADELVHKHVPELYDDIIAQLEDEFSAEEEYRFSVPVTLELFDSTLFGETVV